MDAGKFTIAKYCDIRKYEKKRVAVGPYKFSRLGDLILRHDSPIRWYTKSRVDECGDTYYKENHGSQQLVCRVYTDRIIVEVLREDSGPIESYQALIQ